VGPFGVATPHLGPGILTAGSACSRNSGDQRFGLAETAYRTPLQKGPENPFVSLRRTERRELARAGVRGSEAEPHSEAALRSS